MVRIDLTPLSEGIHRLELAPGADELGLDPAVFGDIRVEALVDYRGGRALVHLKTAATATLECDRTLVAFEQPVEGAGTVLFVSPEEAQRLREREDRDEEVHVLYPADRVLDLTEILHDALMLSLPVRRIAPGAEDVEIPTVFRDPADEAEDAIDPRWEALRKLRPGDARTGS